MGNFIDKAMRFSTWIILVVSLIAYFAYQVLDFNGDITTLVNDWRSYVHMLFVIFISVQMINASNDSAISNGIKTNEFTTANELDAKLITEFNNNTDEVRSYVKLLNAHELRSMQDDFLYKNGDLEYDDLSKKLKRKYNNLKPIVHNVYGFNTPLNYDIVKGRQINYAIKGDKKSGIRLKKLSKIFTSVLFGVMTVDMVVNFSNVGSAMISVLIITAGLILTFASTYVPVYNKYVNRIPSQVLIKNTFMDGFKNYQAGNVKLLKMTDNTQEMTDIPVKMTAMPDIR